MSLLRPAQVIATLAALSCAGCVGEISGGRAGGPASAPAEEPTHQTVAEPERAGPVFLRALTAAELAASVTVVFGSAPPSLERHFPAQTAAAGFDNNAELVMLSEGYVTAVQAAAEETAAWLTAPARLGTIFTCTDPRAQCLSAFAAERGRLAYRRSLSADEVGVLVQRAQAFAPGEDVQWLVETLLQGPEFVSRVELTLGSVSEDTGEALLAPHEIATRLSFLLHGRGPSAALLDAAAAGELATADGRERWARLLLSEPDGTHLRRFPEQWLKVDRIDAVERSSVTWPQWTQAVRAAAREEARRVVADYSGPNEHLLEVLRADHGYVDAALAPLYGLSPPSAWQRVDRRGDAVRGPWLTMVGPLSVTAPLDATAPIKRGFYVRTLMCQTFSLPAMVPALPETSAAATASERERLEQHRRDPSCSGCHGLLEPLGFALARYDAIGRYRERDGSGEIIDDSGSFSGFGAPELKGAHELTERLLEDPALPRCASRAFVRFAQGRLDRPTDAPLVARLSALLESDRGSLPELAVAFVRSDAFVSRGAP